MALPTRFVAAFACCFVACGARSGLREPSGDAAIDTPAPICVPEPEQCNGRDDDCNGLIDDGLGFGALGPAVVVRSNEGDTGGCGSCRWAWDPFLAPMADGSLLALWWIGINGGREQPNVWGRRLSEDGTPLEPPRLWTRDFVILDQQPIAAGTLPGGDSLLGATFRIGTSDTGGWLRVRADGTLVNTSLPATVHGRSTALFSNSRVTAAWSDFNGRVDIASTPLDTAVPAFYRVALPGVAFVSTGSFGDRFGIVALTVLGATRELHFLAHAATGEAMAPPRRLLLDYESYPRLIGTTEGWLYVTPGSRMGPARFARLDQTGAVISPQQAWPDGHRLDDSGLQSTFVHDPRARQIVAVRGAIATPSMPSLTIELMDEQGGIVASTTAPAPGTGVVASPSVYFGRTRIMVAWHDVDADNTPNRVYLQSFGCTP